jgi:Ser/Thr protein kinase RdoA (MazF antagonist)
MTGPTDCDARHVLQLFGIVGTASRPLGNHSGFSGARLWRVSTPTAELCLKAWPPGVMSLRRHREVVRLVRHARRAGLAFIPVTSDPIEYGGRIWDLADWMPGLAELGDDPSPGRVHAACVAMARLHLAWGEFASAPAPCPAVLRRLNAVRERQDNLPLTLEPADPLFGLAKRARQVVSDNIGGIRRPLDSWSEIPLALQPCLCDVWRAHVLFTRDTVTGLIDFGAVKVDNVAIDLARLLGSLVGDDRVRFEAGLDSYSTVRQLGDAERALAVVLDRSTVVLGLANWLWRLGTREWIGGDRTAVAGRIGELARRIEAWGKGPAA